MLTPVLGRLTNVTTGAGTVPISAGLLVGLEAASWNTRVLCASDKDIRVGRGEHLGHHGARRVTNDEDLLVARAVLGLGVLDHVDDGLRVSAAIVPERSSGRDVPAGTSLTRRAGEDHHEALLLGGLGPVGVLAEVARTRTRAVVHTDYNRVALLERLGHVRVHERLGRRTGEAGLGLEASPPISRVENGSNRRTAVPRDSGMVVGTLRHRLALLALRRRDAGLSMRRRRPMVSVGQGVNASRRRGLTSGQGDRSDQQTSGQYLPDEGSHGWMS